MLLNFSAQMENFLPLKTIDVKLEEDRRCGRLLGLVRQQGIADNVNLYLVAAHTSV